MHARSLVAAQLPPEAGMEPAGHTVLQLLQGSRPVGLHELPFTQGSAHVLVAVFQA